MDLLELISSVFDAVFNGLPAPVRYALMAAAFGLFLYWVVAQLGIV